VTDRLHQLKLLKKLQEVDFVLMELTLYLDTHPNDIQALEQFNHYARKGQKIRRTYEAEYGPLLSFGQSLNRFPGGWNEGPWPWEL
jgi:spore coat protein JB